MARTSKRQSVEAEIARLPDLGLAELRERWVGLYDTPAPKYFRRGLLVRAIAYQIQVKAFGGLSETTKQRLRESAAAVRDGTFEAADLEPRIKPGTKLIRTWKKETHEVTALEDGFAWRGARYSSLSTIAKTITGTSWNGWKFFGLKGPVRKDGFDARGRFKRPKRRRGKVVGCAPGKPKRARRPERLAMRESGKPQELRCGIYTRKSSEEGLEQDFNSLHAQREACQAYIKSQKHEGWRPLSAQYDDGGYSGGTMDRPALRRLLADIQAKRIDIVVVYNVDRLTRSLADFAKIVEVFDASGVSFVSVTQAFNTTSSMGRLTLNVLLSFAQFEREVTGERIRDKIAASKKKGLWMGGFVPFGYRAKDRTLTIDKDEAETVRLIYSRYLELGTVSALEAELAERNVRTRSFTSASNKAWGGRLFSRGHLYKILSSPIYAGKIVHNDKQHEGQHEAIIDRKTFGAVQARLAANNRQHRTRVRAKEPNLLAGLLFDSNGNPLTSSHTVKNGKRYRYYVGSRTEQGKPKPWRLPAHEIELVVLKAAQDFLGDRQRVATALKRSRLQVRKLKDALEIASDLSAQINAIQCRRETALKLIKQIVVSDSQLVIEVKLEALTSDDARVPLTVTHRLTIPIDLDQQNGGAIVIASASDRSVKADPALVKALARGFAWFEELATGGTDTVTAIAKREHVTDRYVSRLVELAFIDPRIIQRMLAGTARSTISTTRLVFETDLPTIWSDQQKALFASRSSGPLFAHSRHFERSWPMSAKGH